MDRPLRIEYPDAVYHGMNRGLARQAAFRIPTDYETFFPSVEQVSTKGLTSFLYLITVVTFYLVDPRLIILKNSYRGF